MDVTVDSYLLIKAALFVGAAFACMLQKNDNLALRKSTQSVE